MQTTKSLLSAVFMLLFTFTGILVSDLQAQSCGAPTSIACGGTTVNSITVNYTPKVTGAISRRIYYQKVGAAGYTVRSWFPQDSIGGGWYSTTIPSLVSGTTYRIWMRVKCTGMPYQYSDTVYCTTGAFSPLCVTPTNVTSDTQYTDRIQIDWDSMPGATSYDVKIQRFGSSGYSTYTGITPTVTAPGRLQYISSSTLLAGYPHTVTLTMHCAGGGRRSKVINIATLPVDCQLPTYIACGTTTVNSIQFEYAPLIISSTSRRIYYRKVGATGYTTLSSWTQNPLGGGFYSANLTGLDNNSSYQIWMRLNCGGGYIYSDTFICNTDPVSVDCVSPTLLTCGSTSYTDRLQIEWDDMAGAASYDVRVQEISSVGYTDFPAITTTPIAGSRLQYTTPAYFTAGNTYNITLYMNCTGGGRRSSTVTCTTLTARPEDAEGSDAPMFFSYEGAEYYNFTTAEFAVIKAQVDAEKTDVSEDVPASEVFMMPVTQAVAGRLECYPNPATSSVFINLSEQIDETGTLMLFDMSGNMVRQINVQGGSIVKMNLAGEIPAGVYLLKYQGVESSLTSRLVVQP